MNDLTETTGPLASFQNKVAKKLRKDIGDMLPDGALAELVQRAVEDQFFNERVVDRGGFNGREIIPSWFVSEVAKIAEPVIKKHVEKYVADNEATIRKAVDQYLTDANLTLVAIAALQDATRADFIAAMDGIARQLSMPR